MTSSPAPVKVFLAEDSLPIRERLHSTFTAAAMDVVGGAATPAACVDGILLSQPDVVVLDHSLVGGNGLEVLQAVRDADPEVAFVVFSSNSAPVYRKRYLREGAVRFLDKDSEFDQLTEAVASAGRRSVH